MGDLYALMKIVPGDDDVDRAVIMNKRGKRFRVRLDYLEKRCDCLTKRKRV